MLRVGIRVLPLVEMLIGMWLIFGLWATTALGVTTFILAAFTVALLVLVRREYIGSCACFGMADQRLQRAYLLLCTVCPILVGKCSLTFGYQVRPLPAFLMTWVLFEEKGCL